MENQNSIKIKPKFRFNKKALIITLGVVLSVMVIVGISVLGYYVWAGNNMAKMYKRDLEGAYQRSYFDLVSEVSTMENELYKLKIASSTQMQITLLDRLSKSAFNAETNLSAISIKSANLSVISKFLNQTGGYAQALSKKLTYGGFLTEDEFAKFKTLSEISKTVGTKLAQVQTEIAQNGFRFMDNVDIDEGLLNSLVTELENSTIEYPSLIFDGPFSDGLTNTTPKTLSGDVLSPEAGAKVITERFKFVTVGDVSYLGRSENHFVQLIYTAVLNGNGYNISISETGGQIVEMSLFREVIEPNLTAEECAVLARQYVEKLGYKNMEAVWVSNNNSTVYVNLAPKINNIIYYPDLVKVKIASDNGEVLGMECLSYIFNHKERSIGETVKITQEQALKLVSKNLNVSSIRLALIPYDGGSERLTYEVCASFEENTYYLYLSVENGVEISIMRVIEGDEGSLII